MTTLILSALVLIAAAEGAPGPVDRVIDAASAIAPVKALCADAMLAKRGEPNERAAIEGLCGCAVDGFMAATPKESAEPFVIVWGEVARWVGLVREGRLADDAIERERAAIEALRDALFGDAYRGQEGMERGARAIETVAGICLAGFKASGATPPAFDAARFVAGLDALAPAIGD